MPNRTWKRAEKSELAKAAGITQHRLGEFVKGPNLGGRMPTRKMAVKLEMASEQVLGKSRAIPAEAWLKLKSNPLLDNYFNKDKSHG